MSTGFDIDRNEPHEEIKKKKQNKKQKGDKDTHTEIERVRKNVMLRGKKKKATTVYQRERTKSSSSESVLSPAEKLFLSLFEVASLCVSRDKVALYVN